MRLLILTGQRRQEVGGLAWREVNIGAQQLELPGERTKNGQPHIVPLSTQALALIGTRELGRDWVFGSDFSLWSNCKIRLEARLAKAGHTLAPWTVYPRQDQN